MHINDFTGYKTMAVKVHRLVKMQQQFRWAGFLIFVMHLGAMANPAPQLDIQMAGGNQPFVVNGIPVAINTRADVTLVSSSYVIEPNNYYKYRYELSDGTIRYETGFIRHVDGVPFTIVAEGFYVYKTADGQTVRFSYLADQNGLHVLENSIGVETEPLQDDDKDGQDGIKK